GRTRSGTRRASSALRPTETKGRSARTVNFGQRDRGGHGGPPVQACQENRVLQCSAQNTPPAGRASCFPGTASFSVSLGAARQSRRGGAKRTPYEAWTASRLTYRERYVAQLCCWHYGCRQRAAPPLRCVFLTRHS